MPNPGTPPFFLQKYNLTVQYNLSLLLLQDSFGLTFLAYLQEAVECGEEDGAMQLSRCEVELVDSLGILSITVFSVFM